MAPKQEDDYPDRPVDDQDRERQDQVNGERSLESVVKLVDKDYLRSPEIVIHSAGKIYTFKGYATKFALNYSDPPSIEVELSILFEHYSAKKLRFNDDFFIESSRAMITISDDSLTQDRTAFTDKFRQAYERALIEDSYNHHNINFLVRDELFDLVTRPLEPGLIQHYKEVRQTLEEEEKKRAEKDLPGREEPR